MKPEPSTSMTLRDRTKWHLIANTPVAAWLAAMVGVVVTTVVTTATVGHLSRDEDMS